MRKAITTICRQSVNFERLQGNTVQISSLTQINNRKFGLYKFDYDHDDYEKADYEVKK